MPSPESYQVLPMEQASPQSPVMGLGGGGAESLVDLESLPCPEPLGSGKPSPPPHTKWWRGWRRKSNSSLTAAVPRQRQPSPPPKVSSSIVWVVRHQLELRFFATLVCCILLLFLYSIQLPGSLVSGVLLVTLVACGLVLASTTRALVSNPVPVKYEPIDTSSWTLMDPVGDRAALVISAVAGKNPLASIVQSFTSVRDVRRLNELKTLVDRQLREGNLMASSLHHLVFHVLPHDDRDKLLSHFDACCKEAGGSAMTSRIVVSDIDDTLAPTFKDRRGYQWGAPYPGVKTLYAELAGVSTDNIMDRLVFVTARPGFLASWTRGEMKASGFAAAMILFGSTTSSVTPPRMLARKQKQIKQIRSLWPECELVLIGDNGQMDISLGTALLAEGVLQACAIHDIFESSPANDTPELIPASELAVGITTSPAPGSTCFPASPNPASSSSSSSDDDDDVEKGQRLAPLNNEAGEGGAKMRRDRLAHTRQTSAPAALSSFSDTPRVLVEHSRPLGFRHDECKSAGISLFQTYAGAALACYHSGLLDIYAMRRVVEACARDLGDMNRRGTSAKIARKLCDSTLRDVSRVALILEDGDKVEFLDVVCSSMR